MEEVVDCIGVANFRPRHQPDLIFGNKAISGAFLFGSFILGMHKIVGNEFGRGRRPEGESHGCDESNQMNSPLGETNQESDRFLARGCAESYTFAKC